MASVDVEPSVPRPRLHAGRAGVCGAAAGRLVLGVAAGWLAGPLPAVGVLVPHAASAPARTAAAAPMIMWLRFIVR